jgi:hypothetical protein
MHKYIYLDIHIRTLYIYIYINIVLYIYVIGEGGVPNVDQSDRTTYNRGIFRINS